MWEFCYIFSCLFLSTLHVCIFLMCDCIFTFHMLLFLQKIVDNLSFISILWQSHPPFIPIHIMSTITHHWSFIYPIYKLNTNTRLISLKNTWTFNIFWLFFKILFWVKAKTGLKHIPILRFWSYTLSFEFLHPEHFNSNHNWSYTNNFVNF